MPKKLLNGAKDGNGFDKNPQNINRKGRPKRFADIFNRAKEEGIELVTNSEIEESMRYLLSVPFEKILEIAGDIKQTAGENSYPSLLRIIASEMKGKAKQSMLATMLNRTAGMPVQKSELTGADGAPLSPIIQISVLGNDISLPTSEQELEDKE